MRMTLRSAAAAISLVLVGVLAFSATSAGAQSDDSYVGAEVKSATLIRTAEPVVAASVKSSNEALAFTGSDALTVGLVGVVAIMAGTSLLVIRRRSNA